MSDQTIKADADKPRISLVPTRIMIDIARVREFGVQKYPYSKHCLNHFRYTNISK